MAVHDADLRGRRVIVTGANSGIGYETAAALAARGASVMLACRDTGRGGEARGRLLARERSGDASVAALDLADLASVRRFAAEQVAGGRPIDLLINNAGVMAPPRGETVDGFELQFGTNHLGHFALTGLLLPALLAAPAPRVVTVSSGAHKFGRLDLGDLQSTRGYRRWEAYGASKLANLLFMFELHRRSVAAGSPLVSVAAHPGLAATALPDASLGSGARLYRLVSQSAAAGAAPTVMAGTADLPGGSYVGPGGFLELRGRPTLVTAAPAAHDPEVARRLWEASEELTGVTYEALGAR
jgi:NAD(P)-dependent dehydrogenase (short-subunit alcohol dehydrogenase family)